MKLFIFFFSFFICLNATIYTFIGNENDFLHSSNWSPQLTGHFIEEDDLILSQNGEFDLSIPIFVNSITIEKDISINGDEITLKSITFH